MSKTFPLMMLTCLLAIAVYYFFALILELPGIYSMAAGIAAAILVSWILAKHKGKKEDK